MGSHLPGGRIIDPVDSPGDRRIGNTPDQQPGLPRHFDRFQFSDQEADHGLCLGNCMAYLSLNRL